VRIFRAEPLRVSVADEALPEQAPTIRTSARSRPEVHRLPVDSRGHVSSRTTEPHRKTEPVAGIRAVVAGETEIGLMRELDALGRSVVTAPAAHEDHERSYDEARHRREYEPRRL